MLLKYIIASNACFVHALYLIPVGVITAIHTSGGLVDVIERSRVACVHVRVLAVLQCLHCGINGCLVQASTLMCCHLRARCLTAAT